MGSASDNVFPELPVFQWEERDAILEEWERIDRQALTAARQLSREELRNSLPDLLRDIIEQAEKHPTSPIEKISSESPKLHAEHRWNWGFTLEEVSREYALLRTVILQRLASQVGELPTKEMIFLHQTLDQAIIEAVVTYVARANQTLEDERERLQVTLRSIGDGVVSTDASGKVVYLNPAAEQISGWPFDEAVGRPVEDILVPIEEQTGKRLKCLTEIVTETGKTATHPSNVLLRKRDGELLPVDKIAAPLRDFTGRFLGVVTTFRDVSQVRSLTTQLGYLAGHDPLTDLPNRMRLLDRLSLELAHAERNKSRLAVLYLDLDLFKEVNDTHGHFIGDRLLKRVAVRLCKCVRRTDTVSRLGGDEFAILLTDFASPAYLTALGDKVVQCIRKPYVIESETIEISTSVGISLYPEDGRNPETLIKHADMAMYKAKERGRNNLQLFAPEMNAHARERRRLATDLKKAVSADQLSLYFQPQIALGSGRVIGAEALLRWRHPKHGLVLPQRFIPVAEDNRQTMITIGNWVLEQACRQARAWRDAGYPPLRVSVNLSLMQLLDENLAAYICETLDRFQVAADDLQLELTETVIMSDIPGAVDCIRKLRSLGVPISVDDFGTGYSSLSYLKNLPVDELKIDQSFVRALCSCPENDSIVQAIIRMGQSMHLRVVAEGVESPDEVAFLTAQGCDVGQGYFYSRAKPADAFARQYLGDAH